MPEENWKPIPEAATEAGAPPERTIYRWVKQGRLPTRQEGGVTLVEVGAVQALAARRAAAKGPAAAGTGAGNGGGSGGDGLRGPGEVASEVFASFEDGVSPIDVVREKQLPPERVAGLHRSWLSLKDAERSGPTIAERLTKIERELQALREVLDQRTSFGDLGSYVDALHERVAQVEQRLDGVLLPSTRKFACSCGTKGFLAVHIQCTACGLNTTWGFHPPK